MFNPIITQIREISWTSYTVTEQSEVFQMKKTVTIVYNKIIRRKLAVS